MTVNILNTTPNLPSIDDWQISLDTADNLPTEFSNSPTPEKSGFCSWVRNFFNYLTGTHGEKLSPVKLNFALDDVFCQEKGWKHEHHFENGGVNQVGLRSQQLGGKTYIVSSACHDLTNPTPTKNDLSGGRTVAQTLNEIKNTYPNGEVKTLIPIAQSNEFGFSTRGHFVLLEVDINTGKIQSVKIHDSKNPLLNYFYDGAQHLTKQLLADENLALDKNFIVTSEHLGHQVMLNGNDCGRYAAYYAYKIINDGDLAGANATEARTFFTKHAKLA
ncbi:MAG TPA: hypothetical protein ACHBX0_12300 [Arsenophonus sp.]